MNSNSSSSKAAGGKARAEKLSTKERSRIASEAAKARWAQKKESIPAKYTVLEGYSDSIDIAGSKIPCAVIQGPDGIQRVLSETGITQAMLGARSGASKRLKKIAKEDGALLPIFIAPSQLEPFIDKDLRDGPLRPIIYQDGERSVVGYAAEILPAVCNVWLKAREAGALQKQQLSKALKAEMLIRALASTGIVALVDEATGYEKIRPQKALEAYLNKILTQELTAWAKKFPDEFYENIYKLKGWPWPGMQKNRYSVVAKYTNNLVYERLAHGVLRELQERTPMDSKGRRANKFHQWLSEDFGNPMLAQHLHSIIVLQRLAIMNGHGWQNFLKSVDQVLPKKGSTLELELDEPN